MHVILESVSSPEMVPVGMAVGRRGDTLAVAYHPETSWPDLVGLAHELLSPDEILALWAALRAQSVAA